MRNTKLNVRMASSDLRYVCRVCGFIHDTPIWNGFDQILVRESCICCGVWWGEGDRTLEDIRTYRAEWLKAGAKWKWPSVKPSDWDVEKQLLNIPAFFQ